MPTGTAMPSWSSTTKSCGRTCRISRPPGSATARAASIARLTSSRVISRLRPATATTPRLLNALTCAPDSARCTLSISTPAVSSASSSARLIASAAESTLLTTPRRMPFDSARPMPMMSRPPSSMTSPTITATLAVPTSSPTRYRSLRAINASRLPFALRAPGTSLPPFERRRIAQAHFFTAVGVCRAAGRTPARRTGDPRSRVRETLVQRRH